MYYAFFLKRQFSHKDGHHWNFAGVVHSEGERDELIADLQEEIDRTAEMRLRTIGYHVVELD